MGAIVQDIASSAPQNYPSEPSRAEGDAVVRDPRDLAHGVTELLAIVGYLTGDDGPLRPSSASGVNLSPLHLRLLSKAMERLQVIDAFLRGRVAFFVAGKGHGYHVSDADLDLAGASLDTCRAATSVVDALIGERLPGEREFESMSSAALEIYAALEASRD
jgi:hypothetical protein